MAHDAIDPAFRRLIDEHAPVRQVGHGFTFTEGPIWHPTEHCLLFSDMPADKRRRLDRDGVREVLSPSNKGNGMTYDARLNLLVCEHSTSSVARFAPDGRREVLCSHFEGRELNSPNDLCVKSDGSIWFTDPWYGRMAGFGVERPRELGFQGVYRMAPDHRPGAEPTLVVDRYLFSMPNGLCFSPDEARLYVNDTEQANIRVFDVDGAALRNGRTFASGIRDGLRPGLPDGMKCDAQGNVWVTAPGGLWVYDPAGKLIGKVSIPEMAANLHWGGADWRTLYVCATTSVYAVDVKVGPRNEPFMRASAGAAPAEAAKPARDKPAPAQGEPLRLDARRCALIIQDMQNDVVMEGGAFADSGAPAHCRDQDCVANIARLAERCRALGVPIIHVHFLVPPGAAGLTLNAPLFEGVLDGNALVKGSWGGAPVAGLEPQPGDFTIEKNRMSAWEGTMLETILKAEGRDMIIETGAWTNMSIEHTARTGADKGYVMVIPQDCCATMNADWHRASIDYAMRNVALVTDARDVIAALA
jgi:gluconolactonase